MKRIPWSKGPFPVQFLAICGMCIGAHPTKSRRTQRCHGVTHYKIWCWISATLKSDWTCALYLVGKPGNTIIDTTHVKSRKIYVQIKRSFFHQKKNAPIMQGSSHQGSVSNTPHCTPSQYIFFVWSGLVCEYIIQECTHKQSHLTPRKLTHKATKETSPHQETIPFVISIYSTRKFCGPYLPLDGLPFVFGSDVTIRFHSDATVSLGGFLLEYHLEPASGKSVIESVQWW